MQIMWAKYQSDMWNHIAWTIFIHKALLRSDETQCAKLMRNQQPTDGWFYIPSPFRLDRIHKPRTVTDWLTPRWMINMYTKHEPTQILNESTTYLRHLFRTYVLYCIVLYHTYYHLRFRKIGNAFIYLLS